LPVFFNWILEKKAYLVLNLKNCVYCIGHTIFIVLLMYLQLEELKVDNPEEEPTTSGVINNNMCSKGCMSFFLLNGLCASASIVMIIRMLQIGRATTY
jgi:hypothetical protein